MASQPALLCVKVFLSSDAQSRNGVNDTRILTGCAPGTFSTSTGAGGADACVDCFGGSFQAAEGAASCELCPAGKFAPGTGATACIDCAAGTYQAD